MKKPTTLCLRTLRINHSDSPSLVAHYAEVHISRDDLCSVSSDCLKRTTSQPSQILTPNDETQPVKPSAFLRARRNVHAVTLASLLFCVSPREHVWLSERQSCACGSWQNCSLCWTPRRLRWDSAFSKVFSPASPPTAFPPLLLRGQVGSDNSTCSHVEIILSTASFPECFVGCT